jgi:hypothetical protein
MTTKELPKGGLPSRQRRTGANVAPEPAVGAHEMTAKERELVDRFFAARNPAPGIKAKSTGSNAATISLDHADQSLGATLLAAAVADRDGTFMPALVSGLAKATAHKGKVDEAQLNFALSVVKGIEPRDPLETMLAAQMAITHNAILTFARRLNQVETIPQDSAERALNKLARTYTMQLEAQKRYRSGGEQTVRVEHVTVNEGGQAIVGNVTTGGRGEPRKSETTP